MERAAVFLAHDPGKLKPLPTAKPGGVFFQGKPFEPGLDLRHLCGSAAWGRMQKFAQTGMRQALEPVYWQ